MEFKEEVHSDDGSYELVNFDDYSGDMKHLNTKADVSSNTDLSNVSAPIKSSSLDSPNKDSRSEDSTDSDSSKEDDEGEEEEEEEVKVKEKEKEEEKFSCMNIPESSNMAKRQEVMAMSYQKLKGNVTLEEVAKDHILQYLPAKSLSRCKLISKQFNSRISTPFFSHIQSQHFSLTSGFFQDENQSIEFFSLDTLCYGVPHPSLSFLPQEVSIKSSCNGLLLCQALDDDNKYYVCNPANKQWNELPCSDYYHGKDAKIVLAFEPSSLNFEPHYHVICPFSLLGEGSILYFDIYDSNTKYWRTSEEICMDFDGSNVKSDGVFVNGVVYWEATGGKMLAFDLKNEIYGVQTLPIGGTLTKLYGELCYVKGRYRHSKNRCVLEVYRGGLMSVKKGMSFGVPLYGVKDNEVVSCKVVGNSRDDVLGVIMNYPEWQNRLFVYRFKDRKVEGPWFLLSSNHVFPYVNSLVSISS